MTDINDDRHRGLQCGHVGEVLFRTNAHVDAALLRRLQQQRNDVLEACFIGEEIIGTENSIFLRPFF